MPTTRQNTIGVPFGRWKHGHAIDGRWSKTYSSWQAMVARCTSPNNGAFPAYGAKGVTVCTRWRCSFTDFLADMGERPPNTVLDRWPNRRGNYEPGNCRWATYAQSNRNKANNRLVVFRGVAGSLAEVCEHFAVSYRRVWRRLKAGQSVASAFENALRSTRALR